MKVILLISFIIYENSYIFGGAFCFIISTKYLKYLKYFLIEYPILILCSILGMMVMISSNDLMVFYIGLELQSSSFICFSII